MKNIVLFASDNKGTSSLINIVRELQNRNYNYFFLYSQHTQLQHPTQNMENFVYDSNCEIKNNDYFSKTMNTAFPFKPEILIIQRENWEPEQSIMWEFKHKWNCKIVLIEINSHIINNYEARLELLSRTNYAHKLMDLYFDHSKYTVNRRAETGFDVSKSKIVGNPKYDNIQSISFEYCYEKYNIDKSKIQILFFGLVNTSRMEALEVLNNISNKIDLNKYELFYKPYPGEPYHHKFSNNFFPRFIIPNVKVIFDDIDLIPMSKLCDIHIEPISSITHISLLLNKKIININNVCKYIDYANSLDRLLEEKNIGVEDSVNFWKGVYKLKTTQELIDLIGLDKIKIFEKENNNLKQIISEETIDYDFNLKCLIADRKNTNKLMNIFDEYNDYSASKRIVNYLEDL